MTPEYLQELQSKITEHCLSGNYLPPSQTTDIEHWHELTQGELEMLWNLNDPDERSERALSCENMQHLYQQNCDWVLVWLPEFWMYSRHLRDEQPSGRKSSLSWDDVESPMQQRIIDF